MMCAKPLQALAISDKNTHTHAHTHTTVTEQIFKMSYWIGNASQTYMIPYRRQVIN